MSTRSKAKRDARKKKSKGVSRAGPLPKVVEHAHVIVGDKIVGGAGLQGEEWVLVLGRQVVAGTDSAAMMLAMLKHAAAIQEESGHTVQLNYSTFLRDTASAEAQAEGKTLDEYLAELEIEREERSAERVDGEEEDARH